MSRNREHLMPLRDARPGDLALFAAWEAAERPYPWTAAQFEMRPESAKRLLVWEEAGVVRAFAALQVIVDEAHLQNFMVDPAHRRAGIGSRLLQKVIILARENGARRFVLDVDPANRPAVALYLKAGFETLERRPRAYPRGEDALVMKKDL